MFLLTFASVTQAEDKATSAINVGIVLDGPSVLEDQVVALVKKEILALTEGEFDVRFPKDKVIVADWTLEGSEKAINHVLNDDAVDILLTLGVISTSDLIQRGPLPKPAIGTVVLDAGIQGAPQQGNASGVQNLSYTALTSDFEESVEEIKRKVNSKHITLLTNNPIDIAIPKLSQSLKAKLSGLGATIDLLRLDASITETLNQINPRTDMVLVAPQTFLSNEDKERLAEGLIEKKLPSFAMAGKSDVELGFLMSTGQDEIDIRRLVRRVALNFQSILLGDKASELPIYFTAQKQLTLNMKTARKIGFEPTYQMLGDAELIHDNFDHFNSISLFYAVQKSLDENLNLASKVKEVAAGFWEVKRAWSQLLPQINLSTDYTFVDEDRAAASGGSLPERTGSASAAVNQLLFSENTFTNISNQRNSQKALESERDELALDIIQATTETYLNCLRTTRIESIQVNNLELSKANLELAKSRKQVGQSSSADVYRWESEIANNQTEILSAKANKKNALLSLNRLMNEPLEQGYDLKDIGLSDESIFLRTDLGEFIDRPNTFKVLRDFMVVEGLETSPEIKGIDALIKVRKRTLYSSRWDFLLPDVSFQATATNNYHEDGSGVPTPFLKDDHDYSAVFKASYPLFEGGGKVADTFKAKRELEQFEIQKKFLEEQISEEVRASLNDVGSSYASIKWSNKAAEAATKNLELVQESYGEGVESITNLLDAQNSALNADQLAANAVYDFLIDYFEYQRAIRNFYFTLPADEKEQVMLRMEQFFKQNGIDLFRS